LEAWDAIDRDASFSVGFVLPYSGLSLSAMFCFQRHNVILPLPELLAIDYLLFVRAYHTAVT